MKLLSGSVSLAILSATIVSSIPITPRDVDEALVPQFGFSAGVNPTGTGDCDGAVNGANGQPVKVPCSCPPDRATFIQSLNANVAAGHVLNNPSVSITFPEDDSTASQLARINAATVTLQNLNGSGQGCPVASTTFQAQAAAINNGPLGVLMARQLSPLPSPIPTINILGPHLVGAILMARQFDISSPSPTPTTSIINSPGVDVGGTPGVSELAPSQSPAPTICVSESATSQTPTSTINFSFPPLIEDILKARDSESAAPTPTICVLESATSQTPTSTIFSLPPLLEESAAPIPTIPLLFPPVVGKILKRDSELAPIPTINLLFPSVVEDILKRDSESAPTPTISLLFPPVVEGILARQSTPSPSPGPEIILAGPPVIEDIL